MGAALDLLCPGVTFGYGYFVFDVEVESVYVRVGGVYRAEIVTLSYELDYERW